MRAQRVNVHAVGNDLHTRGRDAHINECLCDATGDRRGHGRQRIRPGQRKPPVRSAVVLGVY